MPNDKGSNLNGSRRRLLVGAATLTAGAAIAATSAGRSLAALSTTESSALSTNAYSRVKAKLGSGGSASILVIGDSTAFVADFGPYALFAKQIGDLYDCVVIVHQWGEWQLKDTTRGTGPRAYNDAVTLRTGAGPTLNLFLACLPGSSASAMWDNIRRPAALTAVASPDVVVLHHGHNMQDYSLQSLGILGSGKGMFYAALGMITSKWLGVPVAVCTQNPWKNSEGMAAIYNVLLAIGSQISGLTMVDSYASFIAAGRPDYLYRANDTYRVHPSDSAKNHAGAQLVAAAHMSAYRQAKPDLTATTENWTAALAANVISNGSMTDWTGEVPTGFTNVNNALLAKDTVNVYGGEAYSVSLTPNKRTRDRRSGIRYALTPDQQTSIAGKKVTVVVKMTMATSTQGLPDVSCTFQDSGGSLRTYTLCDHIASMNPNGGFDGDYWLVAADIDVGSATDVNAEINICPVSSESSSFTNDTLSVADVILVLGAKPAGRL